MYPGTIHVGIIYVGGERMLRSSLVIISLQVDHVLPPRSLALLTQESS